MNPQTPETHDPSSSPLDCKVVVLTHYLPPYTARVLYYVSKGIRDFGILLSIAMEPNRAFGDTWDGLTVKVQKSWMVRLPWKHSTGFRDDLYVHFPYDTFQQLWRAKPDIVFSYELGFRSLVSAVYCKLARRKLALCVCVSEHTEQGRGFVRGILRRLLLRSADAVTYNGPSCLKYLQRFNVPAEKLFHFPYAATDLFRYQGPLERDPVDDHRLLYIGQMSQRKGILPLVTALIEHCRLHPEQVVELDCIGNGPAATEVEQLPKPDNLKLRLLGHMDYNQLSAAMERCGVMVFPTLADEWGLVVNEAMQAGLPVLGSIYAQACTTLIEEGKNGWLYCPSRPAELSAQLERVLSCDRETLNQMRIAARNTVADITPPRVAEQAHRMFATMLKTGHGQS